MKTPTMLLLLVLVVCSGCGTVLTHLGSRGTCMSFRGEGVYQGVRLDCLAIARTDNGISAVFGVVDFPLSLAADTLFLPCDIIDTAKLKREGRARAPQSAGGSGLEREKQRWKAKGWSFVETFGSAANDGNYVTHMSSPTARTLTAFALASGQRTDKAYDQTNALYLVVSMQRPSGDIFALVFSKPK